MRTLKTLWTLWLGIVISTAAVAHDTWLAPNRFAVEQGAIAVLDLTSGMAFPTLETLIKPDRLEHSFCRLAGRQFEMSTASQGQTSLRLNAQLGEQGIATMWIDLRPRALTLTAAQVREYLDEIGAPKDLAKEWTQSKKPKRWKEIYTKHAKTFVRVGDTKSDNSWSEPVGMKLEIIPERDPTSLEVGDDFTVRVLSEQRPMPGFPVGIVFAENGKTAITRTDQLGRATFRVSVKGPCMLRGTDLRRSTKPGVDWESDFTTLTIRIGS
jgi:uncharacterized GH25 family protein